MQIARDLAGFSMGQADVLRKAMGKKIASLLAEQKEKFIEGCVKNSVYKELAEKIFSFIEPFAGYGFNRSHAACYALIGYQTAYLKAHWPVEFMAALLTSDQGDTDRAAIEIEECRNMGIKIMAPDINESFGTFTAVTAGTKENRAVRENEKVDTIRFGLKAIKNVGENIVNVLIKERKENGVYEDIFDLLERVTDKDLNKKSLESLIKSGALDSFGERGQLLANTEKLLSFNKELARAKDSKQSSLFTDLPAASVNRATLNPATPAEQNEKLIWEKELLGLYVSEHPYNVFRPYLVNYAIPLAELGRHKGDDRVVLAGIIGTIKKIITRSGESMLFVKIEDATSTVEILVFPRLYKETGTLWREGEAVIIDGKVSEKDHEVKILVNRVNILSSQEPQKSVDDFKKLLLEGGPAKKSYRPGYRNNESYSGNGSGYGNGIYKSGLKPAGQAKAKPAAAVKPAEKEIPLGKDPLRIIFQKNFSPADLEELKKVFALFPGNDEVRFLIMEGGKAKVVKMPFRVGNSLELRAKLKNLFPNAIKIAEAGV